jgi:hypothetical protein
LHRTGALDDLAELYPASDAEALAPRALDKWIALEWLYQCYQEGRPLAPRPAGAPALPGLNVYVMPQAGRAYAIGADPAEGNPTSDDSALAVLDRTTGEEVASLAGRFQPAVFASHIDALARWYNGAEVLVERNNHGHSVLLWLRDHSRVAVAQGIDGKDGWLSNSKGKAMMYDTAAEAFRDRQTVLHGFTTFNQLASIEGASLRAPQGQWDDRADAYVLALCLVQMLSRHTTEGMQGIPHAPHMRSLFGEQPGGDWRAKQAKYMPIGRNGRVTIPWG